LFHRASFPEAKGNAPVKALDETPASYASQGGSMFLAAGPEKVASKAKKLSNKAVISC